MVRLKIYHAIRFCAWCKGKLESAGMRSSIVNKAYLFEALGYMISISHNAREISGAGKLLEVLAIIIEGHEEAAREGCPEAALSSKCEELIKFAILHPTEMKGIWNPEKKRFECNDD